MMLNFCKLNRLIRVFIVAMFTNIATAIVILLVVLMMALAHANSRYKDYISGYWVVHPDFAAEADLSEFQLFIGPLSSSAERAGYVIIVDKHNNTIANSPIDIKIKNQAGSALQAVLKGKGDECRGNFIIEKSDSEKSDSEKSDSEKDADILPGVPQKMEFSLSILNGTLSLYDDKKLYVSLVKDIATSDTALSVFNDTNDD